MEPALESFLDHVNEDDFTVDLGRKVKNDNEESLNDGSGMLDMREMAQRYSAIVESSSMKNVEPEAPLMDGTTARNHILSPIVETSESQSLSPAVIAGAVALALITVIAATAVVTATLVRRSVVAEYEAKISQPAPAQQLAALVPAVVEEAAEPALPEPVEAAVEAQPAEEVAAPEMIIEPEEIQSEPEAPKQRERAQEPEPKPAAKADKPASKPAVAKVEVAPAPKAVAVVEPEPEPKPAAKPVESKPAPAASTSCDEVLCLLEGKGCCGKAKASKEAAPSVDSSLPSKLSRADITSGLKPIQGRLNSCGSKHEVAGAVTLKLKVNANGKVASSAANKGDEAFKSCVRSIVAKARFPQTQDGTTLSYPVILR